jgi:hypothetical protein
MKRITKRGAKIAKEAEIIKKRVGLGLAARSALFFIFVPIFIPTPAFATLQITEIMYDVPGADAGREWIEITNTGPEGVDISKYKLLESGTNHGLVFVSGNKLMIPGSSAIIAADPKKFSLDNTAFSGTLFDSAFALSNTGESLTLKNASSTELDTAAYEATEGANGEGGTLHKTAGGFVVGLPNAGTYPGEIVAVPKLPAKEVPAKKTATKKSPAAKAKTPATTPSAAPTNAPEQSASVAQASGIPTIFLWILALAAVLLLGAAGVIFLLIGGKETSPAAEEFKIE